MVQSIPIIKGKGENWTALKLKTVLFQKSAIRGWKFKSQRDKMYLQFMYPIEESYSERKKKYKIYKSKKKFTGQQYLDAKNG